MIKPNLLLSVSTLLFVAAVSAAPQNLIGRYDFSYDAYGAKAPRQVFDDGVATYFQFVQGDLPVLFRVAETGVPTRVDLIPQPNGVYRVEGIAGEYVLRYGSTNVRVVYRGAAGRFGTVDAASAHAVVAAESGRAEPVRSIGQARADAVALHRNSYATPLKGDRVEWAVGGVQTTEASFEFEEGRSELSKEVARRVTQLASLFRAGGAFHIVGREDDGLVEGVGAARGLALRNRLIAGGVPAHAISVSVGAPRSVKRGRWASDVTLTTPSPPAAISPANGEQRQASSPTSPAGTHELHRGVDGSRAPTASSKYSIEMIDGSLSGTLRRWGAGEGYTKVEWSPPADPAITAAIAVSDATNLAEASQALAAGLRAKGYAYSIELRPAAKVIHVFEEGKAPK